MKSFFKKDYKKILILSADVLCLVAALICKPLSALMLSTEKTCAWTVWGGQCLTCGGTHFVNDLLSFRIGQAFMDNQLLFIAALYLFVTLLFLNLLWLFEFPFAKKALRVMYNIPVLILFAVGTLAFLILRNLYAFENLFEILKKIGNLLVERFPA